MAYGKTKKHRSTRQIIITIVVCAVVSIMAILLILFLSGVRYMSFDTADGGRVKFLGTVDASGKPRNGKIVYSIGLYADVDLATGTLNYSNGDIYEGELDGLLKNGQGKMIYENGDVYEGEWYGDLIDGEGVYTYVNGDVYEGEFQNNTLWGEGRYTWPDGRVYEGCFEDGLIVRVDTDNGVGEDPGVFADTDN